MADCKHPTKISSCGIKVCMDCGAPLNAKAKSAARLKAINKELNALPWSAQ